MKHCRKCEVPLVVGDNWTASQVKQGKRRCRDCVNARARAYRRANAEKIKAYNAKYYKANPEKIKALQSEYAKANRGKINAYRKANPGKIKAYYKANAEKLRADAKEYTKANRGKMNAKNAKRRALIKKQTPSWYDHEMVTEIYETAAEFGYHVDHIVPLAKGGLHSHENLQLLTPEENLAKSASDCWIDW